MAEFNMQSFKEKAGPLPVWGWAVIVVGVALLYSKYRAAHNASTKAGNAQPNQLTGQQGYDPTYGAALLTADYDLLNSAGIETATLNNTNSELGILDANVANNSGALGANTNALGNNTGALTNNTQAVNGATVAVSNVGRLVSMPPIVRGPAPVAKPRQNIYYVQPRDNLSRIAMRFYGAPNWQKIYAANRGTIGSNPNLIKPGQKLVIPA